MPLKFEPNYLISSNIAQSLIKIEALKGEILHLPITPTVMQSLRETAFLESTHYSTKIEGNRLSSKNVQEVIKDHKHFPGRKRDENEIKGYYSALNELEHLSAKKAAITENIVQTLHAYVMSSGNNQKVKPSKYRNGQNVIKDSLSGKIVYLPPEAKDVVSLMKVLIKWINDNEKEGLPCPIIAGIAHYQFATIHPYYDGNGRTARLLTTLILHLGGYDLNGIYSLEEYYANNLSAYYDALNIGASHNYYMGRADAEITSWIEYFCDGMFKAFERVKQRCLEAQALGFPDKSKLLRKLDASQRKVLVIFQGKEIITSGDIEDLFCFKPRTARKLCQDLVDKGFLNIINPSKKARTYGLSSEYIDLLD